MSCRADYLSRPAPDPASFGQPTEDDGGRDNPLMRNMPASTPTASTRTRWRRSATDWCIAVGVESGEGPAARGGRGGGGGPRSPVVEFPCDHGGFLDSHYGEPSGTDAVAARLREVLA